jgi:hypothetical protein
MSIKWDVSQWYIWQIYVKNVHMESSSTVYINKILKQVQAENFYFIFRDVYLPLMNV